MKNQNNDNYLSETLSFKDGLRPMKYYPFSNDFMFAEIMQNCLDIARQLLEILMDKPILGIDKEFISNLLFNTHMDNRL